MTRVAAYKPALPEIGTCRGERTPGGSPAATRAPWEKTGCGLWLPPCASSNWAHQNAAPQDGGRQACGSDRAEREKRRRRHEANRRRKESFSRPAVAAATARTGVD